MPRKNSRRADEVLQAKLGAAVRSRRQNLGITQEELAWRADMHRTYVADIERGVRNVTLRSVGFLARALKTSVVMLLSQGNEAEAGRTSPYGEGPGEILLVEDSPADIEFTLDVFEKARISNPIHVVRDGEDAVNFLFGAGRFAQRERPVRPRVVLLDLHLPKVSGLDVLRKIKANEETKAIPVVVLTSSRRDRDIAECRRLGAATYIVKPVEFEKLCKVTPRLSLRWELLSPGALNCAVPD